MAPKFISIQSSIQTNSKLRRFLMQGLVGTGILFVVGMLAYGVYDKGGNQQYTSGNAVVERRAVQEMPAPRTENPGVNVLRVNQTISGGAWKIVSSAAKWSGTPVQVLLTSWYLESGMRLGGDGGGAGGYSALAQVVKKQAEEPHRANRFKENERDLRFICGYCGYNCSQIQGSSTGALGPMQFQPSTWMAMLRGSGAVDADGDGRACPLSLADSIYTAAKKLRRAYERIGSWNGAVLEYAGGNCATNRNYVRRHAALQNVFLRYAASYAAEHSGNSNSNVL